MKLSPCWNGTYRGFFLTVWRFKFDLVYTTKLQRERGW